MINTMNSANQTPVEFVKCPTGIKGLDEITEGGLPQGRPTLVCGPAGCGKTVLAMEFVVQGIVHYDESGVFIAFEETAEELAQNFASLGFDLNDFVAQGKLVIDYVYIERSEIEEAGEYDLDGLFIRIGQAIEAVGAKRVVLDTIEALFSGLPNEAILRAELRRLFRWLKEKGVTAIITGERGESTLTRYGLEEYVADCVIILDHRIVEQIATRRLRIAKYRGSPHGTSEFPFLIDEHGVSVLPITSLGLKHEASSKRISTGILRLDMMLGGKGYYRGSSILVSGTAGTGKTSVGAHFVDAACRRGERCLFFAFEESPGQIMRNMHSIGIDLNQWVTKRLLTFHAERPSFYGLEMHLVNIHKLVEALNPSVVVLDPISNLMMVGTVPEVKSILARLIDFLKGKQITAMLTNLTRGGTDDLEQTPVGVSSLMDTWILLRDIESNGERNRGLYVLKSRGMSHSNQIREFLLTEKGIDLIDVYVGPKGVLTGTARVVREAQEKAEMLLRQQEIGHKQRELERKRRAVEAQIATLRADFEAEEEELQKIIAQEKIQEEVLAQDRGKMAMLRGADEPSS